MSPNVLRKASFLSVIFTKKFHATASTPNPFSKQFFPSQKKKENSQQKLDIYFYKTTLPPYRKIPKRMFNRKQTQINIFISTNRYKKYYFEQEKKDKTFQHVELEVISD